LVFAPVRGAVSHVVSATVVEARLPSSGAAWSVLAERCRQFSGAVRVLVVRFDPPAVASIGTELSSLSLPDVESSLTALARPDLVSVAVIDAMLQGPALAIALGCDLRLCSVDAGLRASAQALGSLGRLADLVGYSRALELCLTGREVHAAEAVALGLATVSVNADEVAAVVDDLVAALVATPRDQAIEMKATLSTSGIDSAAARARRVQAELAAAARLAGEHE